MFDLYMLRYVLLILLLSSSDVTAHMFSSDDVTAHMFSSDDVTAHNTISAFNSNVSSADLYAIVNQWAANFDPDLVTSVWSEMIEEEELSGINSGCLAGLGRIVRAYQNNDTAAARFFDSWGKPSAAILEGSFNYWGSYDECIDLKDTSINETSYCRFPIIAKTRFHIQYVHDYLPLDVGLCFPSSCSAYDYYTILNSTLDQINDIVNNSGLFPVRIQLFVDHNRPLWCPWHDLGFDAGGITVIVVYTILCILVVIGSVLDGLLWYYEEWFVKPNLSGDKDGVSLSINKIDEARRVSNEKNWNSKLLNMCKQFLVCFSLYKTVPEIFGADHPSGAITCVNGIRVISIFWIVLGHTYQILAGPLLMVENRKFFLEHSFSRFTFQVIPGGYKAVDTFLMLGALLLSYLLLRDMERRKGKIPLLVLYVFRFIRISPLYFFTLFFWYKILPHMAHGPNWYWHAPHNCDKYWWTNVLYINNLYPREYEKSCFAVAWYLAADMQLFMISPIFIYLLYHYWPAGVMALIGSTCASWVAAGVISGVNDYKANLVKGGWGYGGVQYQDVMRDIYESPYCRAGAYFVGILLGFVLHKKWQPRKGLRIRVPFYSAVWIVGLVCILLPVYGLNHSFHGYDLSRFENLLYLAVSPTGFSIGVACIIYACHHGYGFIANTILSWKAWIPLSRLTFAVYLVHIPVTYYLFNSLHSKIIYTDYAFIMWYSAIIAWSFVVSIIVASCVEFPLVNVVKFVLKSLGIERRRQQQ